MIKERMSRRLFNWIGILLLILIVASTAYFYTASQSKIRTIDATLALIQGLEGKSLVSGLSLAISDFFNLASIQIMTFFIMNLALLFLLWFVLRLYLIQKTNMLMDPLTGVYNRRAFMFGLKSESERAKKFGHSLSLVLLTFDFTEFSDAAIKKIASMLKRDSEGVAIIGRIGKSEFGLMFPEVPYSSVLKISKTIRVNLEAMKLDQQTSLMNKVNLGIAELNHVNVHRRFNLFDEASKRLYLARLAR